MAYRIFAAGLTVLLLGLSMQAGDPAVLRIGFVDSILQEAPPSRRGLFSKEFSELVHDFTGLKSVVTQGINPETSAKQLDDKKWDVGAFHGVEFAWVKANHPKLQPLMVTKSRVTPVKAVLVTKKEGGANSFSALQGKTVSLLEVLHCQLFMEKATGKSRDQFVKVIKTRNVEEALDDILRDRVQAAIVDTPALAVYKAVQPGRYDRLRIVTESEPFPPAVIVYHEGALSDAMLKRLKDGMLKVNQSDRGRETLDAFKITGFDLVPADLPQQLANILRAYPSPEF